MDSTKYKNIYNLIEKSKYPKDTDERNKNKLKKQAENYFIQNKQLFRKNSNG